METADHHQLEKPVAYLPMVIRIFLALLTAHYVLVSVQTKSTWIIMHQANYYMSLAVNIPVVFLEIQWIHHMTIFLDKKAGWTQGWTTRIILQFALCFAVVLAINISLVRGMFFVFHRNFQASGYMNIEFPLVTGLILAMNMMYFGYYFLLNYKGSERVVLFFGTQLKSARMRIQELEEQKPAKGYSQFLMASLGARIIRIDVHDIACLERHENTGFVWMKNKDKYNIDYKMIELEDMLDPAGFFKTSRSLMFAKSAIKYYNKGERVLTLKNDLILPAEMLHISKEHYKGFRKWFES